jgi:hypothetical protein
VPAALTQSQIDQLKILRAAVAVTAITTHL